MSDNKWLRLWAYVTGLVNQELLLQNEYLAAENRILKARLPRLRLCDGERQTPGGDRKAARQQGAGKGCLHRETRYHPRLVSKTHCQQVRRHNEAPISGSAAN